MSVTITINLNTVNMSVNTPVNINLNMGRNDIVLCEEIEKPKKTEKTEKPKRKYKTKNREEEPKEKKGWKGIINEHDIIDGLRMCPYCDYTTKKCSTMSMHISRIHAEESERELSPHKCQYCNKGFQATTNLQHHIKNHHEINYHSCPIDGCSYSSAKNTTTLANHISAKHLRFCYEDDLCLSCNKNIGSSIKYHVAHCSKLSPMYKKV